jgi:transcription antitermination factor NusG
MAENWYALQSKPNKEDALYDQLIMNGIEVFFPQIRVNPVNPRSKKIKAYFPGYLFVRVDLAKTGLSTLQWMPFTRGMVSFDSEPATVPEALLLAIRKRLDGINAAGGEAFNALTHGTRVIIQEGPFEGYEAIFDTRISGSERVRVLIQLLEKNYMPVELRVGNLKPVKDKKPNK